MDPPRWRPSTTVVIALLGAGLLVVGLQTIHFGEQPEFHYHVQSGPIDEAALNNSLADIGDSVSRDDVVFEVSSLSPSTRAIVRQALATEDGRVTRRGAGNGAPEFEYPGDHYGPGHGHYYLADENDYYQLSTMGEPGFPGFVEVIAGVLLFIVAAPLVLYGLARTDQLRVTASTLIGLGTVTVLSTIDFGWFELTGLPELVGGGLAVGAAAGLAAWFILGQFSTDLGPASNQNGTDARKRWVSVACGGLGVLAALGLYAAATVHIDHVTLATLCFLGFASGAAVEWHRTESPFPRRESRAGE